MKEFLLQESVPEPEPRARIRSKLYGPGGSGSGSATLVIRKENPTGLRKQMAGESLEKELKQ